MPRDMSSEFIRRHVPSQMSMFPEVTPPGEKKCLELAPTRDSGGDPEGACRLAQRCK